MSRAGSKHRLPLTLGGIALSLLLAAVFTFGSLNVPFEPNTGAMVPAAAGNRFRTDTSGAGRAGAFAATAAAGTGAAGCTLHGVAGRRVSASRAFVRSGRGVDSG